MDVVAPPENYVGTANFHELKKGAVLYRLHSATRPATKFNTKPARSPFEGGRFDATPDDLYSYLYAGTSRTTVLAERLLRSVRFDSNGRRLLQRRMVAGRALSRVEVIADLTLLALVKTSDLAAVAQTSALVQSTDYARTRYCGHWLRERFPAAQGFIWQSNRDVPHSTLVLFDDRGDTANALACSPDGPFPLDTPKGIEEINRLLGPYNAYIELP
ncbi:RES domain-containing protein [Actinomadura pelletieri DSM 43383]|uniref:RES domain-containing protein n=1 Tax=Actinomadura pelletieri DSM 43383 TaxID=1120940 RepID=A0A495QUI2_9ACTN|nr:RES family NAD+ phosphorylase [Actinomadura pelletieri]RKS77160.1 RES domain-containing protein [Actinomadura pelletieri DSM 43383]